MQLDNKSIVITGASDGIGRALAMRLARRGTRLTLAARKQARLEEVLELCRNAGSEAIAVPTDVSDGEQCAALIDAAVSAHDGIDVLVNNAGISYGRRFDRMDDLQALERIMQVNFFASARLTQLTLPYLKSANGMMVAVSSWQGRVGFPGFSGYVASKHALQGFCDALRIEVAPEGVRVLVVSPGPVDTDIHYRRLGEGGRDTHTGRRFRGLMPVDECARQIEQAMLHDRRELMMEWRGKALLALRTVAPAVVDRVLGREVARFYRLNRNAS